MRLPLHRLSLALGVGFFIIALTTGYWGLMRGDELLARPDNPRRILAEQRQARGDILDRNGEVLAQSVGAPGEYTRHYPYPDLAPVLGYVSPFYGLAGIEAAEDAVLHGDAGRGAWELFWQETVGGPVAGRAIRLTLDVELQRVADSALGDQTGAVVVLDAATGEVLALASHPTFNANRLEEDWSTLATDPRAPLLNRAILALYQPGGALQPALLAAALDLGLTDLQRPASTEPLTLGASTLTCLDSPIKTTTTVAEAFRFGCPRPFVELGEALSAPGLTQLFTEWRLYDAPALGLPSVASPFTTTLSEASLSAVGQGSLTLTPLHVALLTAAILRHGEMPVPSIVMETETTSGQWSPMLSLNHPVAVFRPEAADAVRALMSPAGQRAIAMSGEGEQAQRLAWFSGFALERYVVTVLLENGDAQLAESIGQVVLAASVTLK